ncbi:MAG: DUF2384 domain-containing protein [Blastochloris sp.]|nr:DUF2384 domain-containing protein [Blastochloris sp.]
MTTTIKKSKSSYPTLTEFRFSHRGAKDYAGLLRHYRTTFKMPQPVVVRLTGFSPRSVAKWSEGTPPSPKQEKALVEMDRLLDGLTRVMKPEQIGHWLKSPSPAFDGSTPLQVVERGEMDRIWRMLYDIESGQPG